jgi:hypothetical protein
LRIGDGRTEQCCKTYAGCSEHLHCVNLFLFGSVAPGACFALL